MIEKKDSLDKSGHIYNNLIADQEFRNWVRNPTDERNSYWNKWIQVNEAYIDEIQRATLAIQKFKFKEEFLSDDKLDDILGRIISDTPTTPGKSFSFPETDTSNKKYKRYLLLGAASIVLLFTLSFLIRDSLPEFFLPNQVSEVKMKVVTNPAGKKSRIRLPDGSTVTLNSSSTISFPQQFPPKGNREVKIIGEAFFEVKKMEYVPFIVKVGGVDVEVKGTSFNVNSFEGESFVEIALVEGEVLVTDDSSPEHSILLKPGQLAGYSKLDGSFQKRRFDADEVIGWKDGVLTFANTSFDEFILQLERWYGVKFKIINNPDDKWRVNGKFKNESLETVLMGVRFTYNLDYKIEGDRVLLTVLK